MCVRNGVMTYVMVCVIARSDARRPRQGRTALRPATSMHVCVIATPRILFCVFDVVRLILYP